MIESNSPLNIILAINSLLTIGLILNQNESAKDSSISQNSSSITNPFESLTWICLFIQLFLLLLKFKFNISTIIIISLLIISCSKGSTEYNGFIKNSSESTILFKVIGDTLVLDSISVPSGQTKKIYYFDTKFRTHL